MADNASNFIPCRLIPLQNHYLLLPNTTIAEVIPMPKLETAANKPDYWLGQYDWQSSLLPVIELESLIENTRLSTATATKLCIVHGINSSANITTYALPCYGMPQLILLKESALNIVENTQDSEFIHCQIQIGNKIAYIPNLDRVETIISQQ
ncbi:MAG: chemotaxis protein CheW [Piscirickettsiaceae bacterium]|nr:chemotaxis protein CheW [Piscirickettsiaceae bacterium]